MRYLVKRTIARGFALRQRAGITLAAAMTFALASPFMVQAAETSLSLELNRAANTERGCMLTFVASNRTTHAISGVAYEFVLFNKEGLVEKMTAFDFGALPQEKTVVRQFELAGSQCPGIGQILVNGAARCDLADPQPGTDGTCIGDLALSSRTDITFIK
ncbi:hypothetical protein [Roseibium sp.]|uniref:hypothetical protein n=1 Tax=Roseibium sp. TaxID=1936156 RepID=UPI003A9816C5